MTPRYNALTLVFGFVLFTGFVTAQPTPIRIMPLGDSITHVEEGHPGLYAALAEAAETMHRASIIVPATPLRRYRHQIGLTGKAGSATRQMAGMMIKAADVTGKAGNPLNLDYLWV